MIPRATPVPRDGLLSKYASDPDVYTDCFEVMHPLAVDLPTFIEAFYTTRLFRLERLVLRFALGRSIHDSEVSALAREDAAGFAAWRVEDRAPGQILLCDLSGATRSWLAVAPKQGGATRLLFGSAVVPRKGQKLGLAFRLFLPIHRIYARALLRTAEWRLRRG